mmetsp:Transcript_31029/g.47053  ORF Transcript_31029/g.47053 Transcript_31029/m.47053 type:complete len:97 (+) Transcript_31029:412-702(+)
MAKRGGALSGLISKRAKLNEQTSSKSASSGGGGPRNPFLTRPVKPKDDIPLFLFQSRAEAKRRQQHGSNKVRKIYRYIFLVSLASITQLKGIYLFF